jgi:hypothetical protein
MAICLWAFTVQIQLKFKETISKERRKSVTVVDCSTSKQQASNPIRLSQTQSISMINDNIFNNNVQVHQINKNAQINQINKNIQVYQIDSSNFKTEFRAVQQLDHWDQKQRNQHSQSNQQFQKTSQNTIDAEINHIQHIQTAVYSNSSNDHQQFDHHIPDNDAVIEVQQWTGLE